MKAANAMMLALQLGLLASCGPAEPSSPLVANLHKLPTVQAAAELDRRLAERFGPGTSEAQLVRQLAMEGFQVGERPGSLCDTPRCAALEWRPDRSGGVAWSVTWNVDESGRISHVGAGTVALLN